MHITWLTSDEMFKTTFHSGKGVRSFEVNLSPTTAGEINLTAIANNAVSTASSSRVFNLYYVINGFSLVAHPSTIYKDASIQLLREDTANLPQGRLTIVIQYGDGNFSSLSIDSGDPSLKHPGHVFSYPYIAEGQYQVVVNISSPIDEQVLTSTLKVIEPIQNITVRHLNFLLRFHISRKKASNI